MTTYTPVYPLANLGVISTEAERRALGLTVFSGDVLNLYERYVSLDGKVRKKTIEGGVTAQFIVTGSVTGGFHQAGTAINAQTPKQSQRTITVDDVIYAAFTIPMEYELLRHYEDDYASQAANVIAVANDYMLSAEILKAARSAATITGVTFGGSQIISDSFRVNAAGAADYNEVALAIFEAVFQAKELFISKRVRNDGNIYCGLRPTEYLALVKAIQSNGFSLSNADFMLQRANINSGELPPIAGIQFMMIPELPSTNLTATGDSFGGTPNTLSATPIHTNHVVDASKTIGIIWHPDCVGHVVKQGMFTKRSEEVPYLSDLMVTGMMSGAGVLRPEAAIELSLDALTNAS